MGLYIKAQFVCGKSTERAGPAAETVSAFIRFLLGTGGTLRNNQRTGLVSQRTQRPWFALGLFQRLKPQDARRYQVRNYSHNTAEN